MSAKRKSITQKLLNLVEAILDEGTVFVSRNELYKRMAQGWSYERPISKAICDLMEMGYLEKVENENAYNLRLTRKGKFKIWRPRKKQGWDGRWRLVAFDIPEKRRGARSLF